MVPGKVIPFRGPRRHRLRGKKSPGRVGYWQRVQIWLAGSTTRGAVVAGVVAGLLFGVVLATALITAERPAPAAVVESLG